MLDVLRNSLRTAHEIAFAVSFLRCSGLGLMVDDIKRFSEQGGRGRILASTYLGITQAEALRALMGFRTLECRLHLGGFCRTTPGTPLTGFHTKFYLFKNGDSKCWVGSSNITKGGLATNIEGNLLHLARESVNLVENTFEELWARSDVVPITEEILREYESNVQRLGTNRVGGVRSNQEAFLGNGAPELNVRPTLVHPNQAQLEALAKLKELRACGETRAAVIAAPGVGKTFLAAFDALQANASSVLFLSHRLEHLSQAHETFKAVFRNGRTYGRVLQGLGQTNADFVFATIQSANASLVLSKRNFDYIVIDEFHHAEAPSYQDLIAKLSPQFMLGLTATPERQDGHDVLRFCDFNVAYEIRLIEAIDRGWLLPFHYFGVSDETVDYSQIPWRSGRFDYEKLENALMLQERVDEILRHALEKGYDGSRRATVCFCAGVRHANFMAKSLNERNQTAVAVTSETGSLEAREEIYRRFQDPHDPLEWLCVSDVLNEGVDLPGINSILFLRPTESATLFIQQLGRGLRLTPDCEVLTVIDFVGHHRAAWLPLSVMHDANAGINSSSIRELEFTPPRNCEVILDDLTLEILNKVRKASISKRDKCLEAYKRLREECDRPYPLDLWGRQDVPDFTEFRTAFKSWVRLRKAAGDAEPWEENLSEQNLAYEFLSCLERDWQQQRVYPYALVWALAVCPSKDLQVGYEEFFKRFSRWRVEYKPFDKIKAFKTLEKQLGKCLAGRHLDREIFGSIPSERVANEVEGRIRLILEKDFKLRHGGTLRSPQDLVLHRRYDRPDIINHFGVQYDPALHNSGFVRIDENILLISKIDTSGALERHQYVNRFRDETTFSWQSQHKQSQDNEAGRVVLDHKANGFSLHLFVQPRAHEKAYYCGRVAVESVVGNAPMNVTLRLEQPLSPGALEALQPANETEVQGEPDTTGDVGINFDLPSESVRGSINSVLLPFYPVQVAAGGFEPGSAPEPDGYVDGAKFGFRSKVSEGLFVTRVAGHSMEPTIPDRRLCVFRFPVVGTRQGRVLLVQHRRISDPDFGGSYTVKRYRSVKEATEEGWTHKQIELIPDNPEYPIIKFDSAEENELRVIGELVAVLAPSAKVEQT